MIIIARAVTTAQIETNLKEEEHIVRHIEKTVLKAPESCAYYISTSVTLIKKCKYIYIYIYIYINILERSARQRRALGPRAPTLGPKGPHGTPPWAQGPPNAPVSGAGPAATWRPLSQIPGSLGRPLLLIY